MKKPSPMDPNAAFPDGARPPTDSDLQAALGPALAALDQVLAPFRSAHPDVMSEWKFSPRSGWHVIASRKQRRLYYLIPRRNDFRLSLVLGDRAIAALQIGPCARRVSTLLKAAKRYPEGTAFSFNRANLEVDLTTALLEAKLAV